MPGGVARLLFLAAGAQAGDPRPGHRFQLVHEEDVARAFVAGVRGVGRARSHYNLAAGGTSTMSDLADALGWYWWPASPSGSWRPPPRWPPACR